MEETKQLLRKKMRTLWDILWALIILYLILDWVLHQATHTRKGIFMFRETFKMIIIGWAVLLLILRIRYKKEINS